MREKEIRIEKLIGLCQGVKWGKKVSDCKATMPAIYAWQCQGCPGDHKGEGVAKI